MKKHTPKNWPILKLSDCLVIKHGKPQKDVETPNGQYPILATGGVIGRTDTPIYSKPSVLIGRKGTIDKPRYMDTPFWTVDTLFYSQIKSNSIPKYIFYKFNTINWYYYNEASGVPSLSASTISTIKIALPPIPEQEKIVKVLEVFDEYLEKLSLKIAAKRRIKNNLTINLLSGKKRLKGYNSLLVAKRLENYTDIASGYGFSLNKQGKKGERYPFLKVSDMNLKGNEKVINSWNHTVSEEDLLILRLKPFLPYSVIFPKIGAAINTNKKRLISIPCLVDNNVMVATPKPNCNSDFLYQWFLTINLSMWASSGGVPSIKKSDIESQIVLFPSFEEQTAIANILTTADQELEALENKKSIIEQQKKFLLHKLITGEIRFPEFIN